MTATENLARWHEAEQAATEGPWRWRNTQEPFLMGARTRVVMAFRRLGMQGAQPLFRDAQGILQDGGRTNLNGFADARFIAESRDAMPALLAFAEAVLAYSKPPWDETIIGAAIRDLAERHLGGAR